MALRPTLALLSVALAAQVLPSHGFVGSPLPAAFRASGPASRLQLQRPNARTAAPLSRTKMALSAVPVQKSPGVFAKFQKTAFAAVVALMMLLGAPAASNAEMKKTSTGRVGGGSFHKPTSSATATAKEQPATAMKGVASPSVADTKSAPKSAPSPAADTKSAEKVKPTKNVATTIKEGADGSKTKVVTTTTTDENGKKTVNTEKTIIKQGSGAQPAAQQAAAPAAAGAPGQVHVIHTSSGPSGGSMMAAAAGAAVGAAAMSAMAPPVPWYQSMNPFMGGGMMMPQGHISPMGMAISIKTAIITSLFLGLTLTIALIFLFRR